MSAYWTVRKTLELANNTGPGDIDNDTPQTFDYIPGEPVQVVKCGFITTTTVVYDTTPSTIEVYRRPTAGASGTQVLFATLTFPTVAPVAGKGVFWNLVVPVAGVTGPVFTDPGYVEAGATFNAAAKNLLAKPGESVFFTVLHDSTSGAGTFFFEVIEKGFGGTDLSNMTEGTVA